MKAFNRLDLKNQMVTFKGFPNSRGKQLLWDLAKKSYQRIYPQVPYLHLEFIRASGSISKLKEKLSDLSSIRFQIVNSYYDYSKYRGHWYVDFANQHLGGGVFSEGFVQEEKMCFVFPELMMIFDQIRTNGSNTIDPNIPIYEDRTGAVLVTNLMKALVSEGTDQMDDFYGNIDNLIYLTPTGNLSETYVRPVNSSTYINVIAIDAKCLPYNQTILPIPTIITYITKAFNGFSSAKRYDMDYGIGNTIIHSGAWGCGAFNNELYIMLAVQVIAAMMAGVEIVFYLKGEVIEGKVKDRINEIIKAILTI